MKKNLCMTYLNRYIIFNAKIFIQEWRAIFFACFIALVKFRYFTSTRLIHSKYPFFFSLPEIVAMIHLVENLPATFSKRDQRSVKVMRLKIHTIVLWS